MIMRHHKELAHRIRGTATQQACTPRQAEHACTGEQQGISGQLQRPAVGSAQLRRRRSHGLIKQAQRQVAHLARAQLHQHATVAAGVP